MTDLQRPPEHADFGLSEDVVARLPRPFVARHRSRILAVGFAIAVTAFVTSGVALSGSVAGAALFGVLLVCAGSVVLLPLAVAAVCAAEEVEDRWLCRRLGTYRAWRAYQDALAAHREAERERRVRELAERSRWCSLSIDRLREAVAGLLERQGWHVERVPSDLDTGVDLWIERASRSAVVRCATGGRPSGPAVARELVTAGNDFGASDAILVAPGGASPKLEEYLRRGRRRAVVVVDAQRLIAADERAEPLWI